MSEAGALASTKIGLSLPKLTPNGPPAMSAVWSLSGGKRTWRLWSPTSAF